MSRVDVRKTHKLFIGGAFPRSESGRTYEVTDSKEQFLANMALASRKDARDAVLAARSAVAKWAAATAYNRAGSLPDRRGHGRSPRAIHLGGIRLRGCFVEKGGGPC
ncbi:MAG: hypothetical protein L7U42_07425 [Candidatus Nanopelagicales bacterium]|nr:hypothetical protein [Candidatus Nanopelagicales bacterium]